MQEKSALVGRNHSVLSLMSDVCLLFAPDIERLGVPFQYDAGKIQYVSGVRII